MISIENLSCGYGKKVVLDKVSATIEKGELTCLLGKNGAGKTTLFKTIMGLLPSLSGNVFIDDNAITSLSPSRLAKHISYVPQAHSTPFPFTVLEVVLMGQFVHTKGYFGKPSKENLNMAYESLFTLGIEHLAKKNFNKLSGGQKQMVLISRAIAQKPDYIAMDEPTANLDLGNSTKVMKVSGMLKKQGFGIIMNTHSPEQALQFADKVILLKNGLIEAEGKPDDVLKPEVLTELYDTKVEIIETFASSGEQRKLLITL